MSPLPGFICESADWTARLAGIGTALRDWQPLWSGQAFRVACLPWEPALPGLSGALRALQPGHAQTLHDDPEAADAWLARWLPVAEWRALESVPPAYRECARPAWPRDIERDVPGRKWQQVEAFVGALGTGDASRLLDWCAGKAHLGRALAARFPGAEVVALEREPRLAAVAGAMALRAGVEVHAHCCDVLGEGAGAYIDPSTHVCALHACGPLHLRLFELALGCKPAALSCAPCCYHLSGAAGARALSIPGQRAWPGLEPDDLRTAVQETVTADAHVRRRRRRLQGWQLGFDALQRELRGVDEYLPLPPVATGVLRGDFADFCRLLAARKGIELPADIDFPAFEASGRRRFDEVLALDLVRQRFRRLIELFVVIDRMLQLHAGGYAVALRSFCARELSPRNLLIQARRID